MSGKPFSTRESRIRWMLKNGEILARVRMKSYIGMISIIEAMKEDGLISRKTYWVDAIKLVRTAAQQARSRAAAWERMPDPSAKFVN